MKRLTQTLAFCLLTVFTAVAQKNYVSEVWVSDLGNPINNSRTRKFNRRIQSAA